MSEERKLEVGDVVVLKSGSRRMMIESFTEDGETATCIYSDTDGKHTENYNVACLKLYVPPKPRRAIHYSDS
jgi:uncharacterized protein YodC (DUF2158 family)